MFSLTILETFAAFTGIIAVLLTAKQSLWCWPVALINVVLYAIVFYQAKLFADTALQLFYFCSSIYGWYYWKKNQEKSIHPVQRMSKANWILSLSSIILAFILLGFGLKNYTSASMPLTDSLCVAMSLCAQLLMAKRYLENWLIWIFADIIYVALFIFKELYLTAVLYAIFIAIAIAGYSEWKKTWISQNQLKV